VPPPTDFELARLPTPLPHLDITFAANSTREVESLIGKIAPYIEPGDSFDLVSGSPERTPLNVSAINLWASLLRSAYPTYPIYAHTAGLANYRVLAGNASPNISGIFYDYEPNYETEFTANFSETLGYFADATRIANAHGLLGIGYPTGKPIAFANWTKDHWNYASLAEVVNDLVVQSQTYCRQGTAQYASAISDVLAQYLAAGAPGAPTYQVTLGNNVNVTPNQVSPLQAYNCSSILTTDGLKTLYLWWGPGTNSNVIAFLKDIGRKANAA